MIHNTIRTVVMLAILLLALSAPCDERTPEETTAVERLSSHLDAHVPDATVKQTVSGILAKHTTSSHTMNTGKGCFRVAAATAKDTVDVNIRVMAEDREIAGKRTAGSIVVIPFCSPGESVEVRVSVYGEKSAFALQLLNPKKVSRKNLKVGGDEDDMAANRIRQLHMGKHGSLKPASDALSGNLNVKASATWNIPLPGDRCITAIAAGEPGVKWFRLVLKDPQGKTVLKKQGSAFLDGTTKNCSLPAGTYTVEVTMHKGNGAFKFQLFTPK